MTILGLPLAALALAQAPTRISDRGVLVVRRDSEVVAREEFRVLDRGGPAEGRQLEATARWSGPPTLTLNPVVQVGSDTSPETLTFTVQGRGRSERIVGAPGAGRFTLRYAAPGVERAREVAAQPPVAIVDDSVFSLYLTVVWYATTGGSPRRVTAVWPRSALRIALGVRDLDTATTPWNGRPTVLRQYVVSGDPGGPVRVWVDAQGRLMKVERTDPEGALVAERAPE